MKVSFYLKEVNKAGETAIFTRICYKGHQVKYYTGESINPDFWDKSSHRAKQINVFPQHSEFNQRLDNIENTIKKITLQFANDHNDIYPNPNQLKKLLDITGIRKGVN